MNNLRNKLQLTLAALAAKLGMKISALQAREKGFDEGSLSIKNAEAVFEALGYRMEIWVDKDGERERVR